MGKNTLKKGKQKEPTAVVPVGAPPPSPSPRPPVVPSPPSAHHIEYPPVTIGTIEEVEEDGGLSGGPVGDAENGSWQNVGSSVDGWAADVPGESNVNLNPDEWGAAETQAHMSPPPQSPQSRIGGRDLAGSYHPQQQLPPPSSGQQIPGFSANVAPHKSSAATNWDFPKSQQQQIWTPEEDEWEEDDGWDEQENGNEWGNSGWNNDNGNWGRQPHSATWAHAISAPSLRSHAPTTGWQSWGEEARRLAKVTFDPAIPSSPSSTRSKPVLSQLQRSQVLNALLNNPRQTQQPYPMPPAAGPSVPPAVANTWQQHQSAHHGNRHQPQQHQTRHREQRHEPESKINMRTNLQRLPLQQQSQSQNDGRRQEEAHDVWGLGDGWSDLHEEEEQQDMAQDPWGRKVHFSPGTIRASMLPSSAPSIAPSAVVENFTVNALPQNKLGLSTYPMSKTLSYAYSGTTPSTESEPGRAAMQRITDFQFVESRGEALKDVQHALYGKQRKATDRFHWLFSPDKDERVSSLLNWINSMSFGIASFGLQKFLQTRERGALVVNAAYRPVHSPSEPAFDWVTWNQIQRTMDRILQESVGYYNPAIHIIVFVVLPSPSGNSVAIWRRKLSIPNNIRLAYQAQITQAMASLRKEYPVLVDELPTPPELTPPPPSAKKKRKWYKLWLSS